MYNESPKSYAGNVGATAIERTHVEELQRAVSAVRSLVANINRLRDDLSGNNAQKEDSDKPSPIPSLLDQLIQTPAEIQMSCEEGFKCLEIMRGYLRLR